MKYLQNMALNVQAIEYIKDTSVISQPWPKLWLMLFHVKGWVWHNHLWSHVGGMLCLNVIDMPFIIFKFVLV